MILIFSFIGDLSTDLVIDWLNFYKYPFYRINSSDLYKDSFKIDILNRNIYFDGFQLPINECKAVWFRKFGLKKDFKLLQKKNVPFSVSSSLDEEHNVLFDTICYLLKDKRWLTPPGLSSLNKPSMLLEAMKVGLDVSDTYIINSKADLDILIENGNYITKSLHEPSFPHKKNITFSMYTKRLTSPMLQKAKLPQFFSASMVQKLIKKEYEIRVFFLNKKLYSMAIFSQTDSRTEIDFRNYNWFKPNRNVPYKLPVDIKMKIIKLMNNIGLNCGSIDLIKTADGKYSFLEINPVGQFGMIDFPCNYNLHKKMALELIKMDK